MLDNYSYEFIPSSEHIQLIGLAGIESSGRTDGMKLWNMFKKSALQSLKKLREVSPEKYTSGLHIYMGEYNDHLWIGFNHPGSFLVDIFMEQLKTNLPDEYLQSRKCYIHQYR